jgi:hypothetical protein
LDAAPTGAAIVEGAAKRRYLDGQIASWIAMCGQAAPMISLLETTSPPLKEEMQDFGSA